MLSNIAAPKFVRLLARHGGGGLGRTQKWYTKKTVWSLYSHKTERSEEECLSVCFDQSLVLFQRGSADHTLVSNTLLVIDADPGKSSYNTCRVIAEHAQDQDTSIGQKNEWGAALSYLFAETWH